MKTFLKFFTYLFCLSFCLLAFSGPGAGPILGEEDRNYESNKILREILQKIQNGEVTIHIEENDKKIIEETVLKREENLFTNRKMTEYEEEIVRMAVRNTMEFYNKIIAERWEKTGLPALLSSLKEEDKPNVRTKNNKIKIKKKGTGKSKCSVVFHSLTSRWSF